MFLNLFFENPQFSSMTYTIIQFSDFDIYATTNTYNDTGYKYKIEHDQ